MEQKETACYSIWKRGKKETEKMEMNGRELNKNGWNSMQNGNKAENECVNLFEFDVTLHRGVFI